MDLFYKRKKTSQLDIAFDEGYGEEDIGGSFIDNFNAAYNNMINLERSDSMSTLLKNAYDPVMTHVDKVMKANGRGTLNFSNIFIDPLGIGPDKPLSDGIVNKELKNPASHLDMMFGGFIGKDNAYHAKADALFKTIKENSDIFPELKVLTKDQIEKQAVETALKSHLELQGITENSPGFINSTARFAGSMAGAGTDPINVAAMALGINPQTGLLRLMLREAIIGGSSEALIQGGAVMKWYDELGLDYSFETFAKNVAAASAFSFVLPGAFDIAGQSVKMSSEWIKKGLKVLGVQNKKKSPLLHGSEELQASIDDIVNSNPQDNSELTGIIAKHEENLEKANQSLLDEKPVEIEPIPVESLSDDQILNALNKSNISIETFEPEDILVDAKTFQFKEGGDEFGVLPKLQGTKDWNPIAAGTVTIYENAQGQKFIADGHQRLGLAKRLKADDPSKDIKINAFVLRETDGITPDMAMVNAAVTNIIRGTGSTLDAAKLLRGRRDVIEKAYGDVIPPQSLMYRRASELVNLGDEPWRMIINGVVKSEYGAIVGRLIPDDEAAQKAAIQVLSRTNPANAFQAEAIVRQVRSTDMDKSVQETLFGLEENVESLVAERAKVLDSAKNIIKKEKSAFNTLVRNASKFEQEGNALARQANEKKVIDDGTMLAMLMSSADKKGELSNALTQAAKEAKATNKYGEAARSFVEALRQSVERGDFIGDELSYTRRPINVTEEISNVKPDAKTEEDLELFSDPVSNAAQRESNQLEEEIFPQNQSESFQSDIDLRNDLNKIIDEGADEATVDAHPAVTKAIEDAQKLPETITLKDYGTEKFMNERVMNFDGETVVGYKDAVLRLYDQAKKLPYGDKAFSDVLKQKKAVIVLGPPAAGKSSIADPVARNIRAAVIDADEAKKVLPEYKGGIGANAVHEESSAIADFVLQTAVNQGDNIVIPKVGGNAKSIRNLINRLKDSGYDVNLMDMKVDYSEARNRMYKRFVKTGRLINPDYVRSVGNNPTKTYNTLKQENAANGYTQIDNNGAINEPKPVIEDTTKILEGADLRLRSGRREGDTDGPISSREKDDVENFSGIEELDPDLKIPFGRTDEQGNEIFEFQNLSNLKEELDVDKRIIKRLEYCNI